MFWVNKAVEFSNTQHFCERREESRAHGVEKAIDTYFCESNKVHMSAITIHAVSYFECTERFV